MRLIPAPERAQGKPTDEPDGGLRKAWSRSRSVTPRRTWHFHSTNVSEPNASRATSTPRDENYFTVLREHEIRSARKVVSVKSKAEPTLGQRVLFGNASHDARARDLSCDASDGLKLMAPSSVWWVIREMISWTDGASASVCFSSLLLYGPSSSVFRFTWRGSPTAHASFTGASVGLSISDVDELFVGGSPTDRSFGLTHRFASPASRCIAVSSHSMAGAMMCCAKRIMSASALLIAAFPARIGEDHHTTCLTPSHGSVGSLPRVAQNCRQIGIQNLTPL
jgi:hypothetical protein